MFNFILFLRCLSRFNFSDWYAAYSKSAKSILSIRLVLVLILLLSTLVIYGDVSPESIKNFSESLHQADVAIRRML